MCAERQREPDVAVARSGGRDRLRPACGSQVVRVERVTVHAGGQAIVMTQGGGGHNETEDRPHAQAALAQAQKPERRCSDPQRQPVPLAVGKGAAGSGAQPGNRNAFRHSRYSREVIELRQTMRELLRRAGSIIEKV